MSYYPHNQPLMNAHGGEEAEGEPSFDMPRSSSHTMHTSASFTHSQSGMVDASGAPPSIRAHSPPMLHGDMRAHSMDAQTVGSRSVSPIPDNQQIGLAIPMPAPPDRAFVQARASGDAGAVQPLPRLSSGSRS